VAAFLMLVVAFLFIVKANRKTKVKSAFLAKMSHEIRTPMNSIIGFSELALDDDISSKTRGYLTKILENSEWLLQIINDILDISKIEAGKMELESVPFDMREVFAGCRSIIMPKAIEKGLLLHFYTEPFIGKKPLGDPIRLRQVLVNLLSNAVKFSDSGMIKVRATIRKIEDKSVTMHFEVKDSGIGMAPEQIEKIFEPYTQAESGAVRKYGGTGLGLPITRSIVEMMGGSFSVESTPGVGSKFSFELTFETTDANESGLNEQRIALNGLEKPAFEGEVLICEDNAMNQQVLCEHLAKVGLKTFVAENGRIGVDTVRRRMENGEKQFDLIFMDIHMPVMDGLEAAAEILALNTGIPMVALTANIMASDRELYKKNGMSDYLSKPFTSERLWSCLMRYFSPIGWKSVDPAQQDLEERAFKQKLIISFVKNNQTRYGDIARALNEGDIKLAHRLAHMLKSNAAQLDIENLRKIAEETENLLKDGENLVTPGHLYILEAELKTALESLAPKTHGHAPGGAAADLKTKDAPAPREIFDELEPLLEDGDPKCLDLTGKLRRIPGTEELIRLMEDLEFEAAHKSLMELKRGMNFA
jgi:CheY-like chemotaxis protein